MPALGADFERLVEIMARLRAPNGCPWDREQTFASIKPYTLEETYEVLQAIDEQNWPALADELGDLLLQILFYAQMAGEQADASARFTIADVLRGLADKLVRRHPHVFASSGESELTAAGVVTRWEEIKRQERAAAREQAQRGAATAPAGEAPEPESLLGPEPAALPALIEAYRVSVRAAQTGFEWPGVAAVLEKMEEEMRELRHELAGPAPDGRRVAAEVGDLLFTAVNVARRLQCEPETALKAANRKFRRRFAALEAELCRRGRDVAGSSAAELDEVWERVKTREGS